MENNQYKKQQHRVDIVDVGSVGQRLDNYLFNQLKGVPKSHVYRLLRKGGVRVNGGRRKPDYKLQRDDQVKIPSLRVANRQRAEVPRYWLESIASRVLYEDDSLLVLNKPAGLSVHRGSGVEFGLIDIVKSLRPESTSWALVHRLDRGTSGCLLVAKNRQTLNALQDCFRAGRVEKLYTALTSGCWSQKEQKVDVPLRKNTLQGGERIVTVDPAGKRAYSHFRIVQQYAIAALAEVNIETGRTHQIRVHAQHIGHPVAGDTRYGDRVFNRSLRNHGLERLFLHATRLEFMYAGEKYAINCPLPDELCAMLNLLDSEPR